jgi:hypothetical protein
MRSLPIAVLFSLVSFVAAFSKRAHTLRNTHARSRYYAETGGMQNQRDVKQNQTVTDGTGYQLVDQYKGQDFLDEA